jgi:hypothetical protein
VFPGARRCQSPASDQSQPSAFSADALGRGADEAADQPVHREQRHLRVVGDRTENAVGFLEISDAAEAEGDVGAFRELDRRPERIAAGAPEQAAENAVPAGHDDRSGASLTPA